MKPIPADKATLSVIFAGLMGLVLLVLVEKSVAEEAPERQDAAAVRRRLHDALEFLDTCSSKWSTVQAYSCWVYIRDRIGEQMLPDKYLLLKVRRDPLLIYTYASGPPRLKGQEHFYDSSKEKHKLSGRRLNVKGAVYDKHPQVFRSPDIYHEFLHLDAMSSFFEKEVRSHSEMEHAQIHLYEGAKINGRLASGVELSFAQQAPGQRFQRAFMLFDDESGMPVHFEHHAWPTREGDKPLLVESYTYWNFKFIEPKDVEARRF